MLIICMEVVGFAVEANEIAEKNRIWWEKVFGVGKH